MKTARPIQTLAVAVLLAAALPSVHARSRPGEDPALNPADIEAAQAWAAKAPLKSCPAGYTLAGPTLCMSGFHGPDSYANAAAFCQAFGGGNVANYGAWRYRILYGDGTMAPFDIWLGPITADNTALYVNSSDPGDFDGETSRFDLRRYVCAKG